MSLKQLFNWQSARKKQGSISYSIASRNISAEKKIFDYEVKEGLEHRRTSQATANTQNAVTDSIIHRKGTISKRPMSKMH